MKKIVEIAHDYLREIMDRNSVAVDFTCGQGFDTLFLASNAKEVYGYDIQATAISQTQALLEEYQINNVTLYHKSHACIDEDVTSFKVGIFNLGYLPHGDKSITTEAQIVIETLNKALSLLDCGGRLVLVLYPGFEAGERESKAVEAFVMSLSSKFYDVAKFSLLNRKACPYLLIIDKH